MLSSWKCRISHITGLTCTWEWNRRPKVKETKPREESSVSYPMFNLSQWLVVWICRNICLKIRSSKGKLLCVVYMQVQHISRHLIITRPSPCITKYRSHFTIKSGSNQFSILSLTAVTRESIRLLNPVSTDSFCSHRRRRDTESYKYQSQWRELSK